MIWKQFKRSGYVTLFNEDTPEFGTFEMYLNGFQEVPVDHYLRPFWLAVRNSSVDGWRCAAGKQKHQYALDYLKDFFIKYPTVPKFAFGFHVRLSHGHNSSIACTGKSAILKSN